MEGPLCPPASSGFRLIETFRWPPENGVSRRDRHLARLARSAARLDIVPVGVEAALEGLEGPEPLRVRLTVAADGQARVTTAPFAPIPEGKVWRIALAEERLRSDDPWLRIKSTERAVYDSARARLPAGIDEYLFLNERGELCEGTITNLFADVGGGLVTPPLSCGLLPGILREELLVTGQVTEALLTPDDLLRAKAVYVGNSLRGLIPARAVV